MIFIAGFCIQETCWEGCSIFTEVEAAWENNCDGQYIVENSWKEFVHYQTKKRNSQQVN